MGFEVDLIDPREHAAHTRGFALDSFAGLGAGVPHTLTGAVRLDAFGVGDGVGFDDLGLGDLQDPCRCLVEGFSDRDVHDHNLLSSEFAGHGCDLGTDPGLATQRLQPRPHQGESVAQVERVGGAAPGGEHRLPASDRDLHQRQVRDLRSALPTQGDEPGAAVPDRDRIGFVLRVTREHITPCLQDFQLLDLGFTALEQHVVSRLEQLLRRHFSETRDHT
ncbi:MULTISPECIES: hypothetical protein [unclassified Nocardioides]|uniref:hypothetical protein n=1 Tax=unclassified Nocardioides TaxID=2615069 RepID=UPI0006FE42AC|nr:MULTISPECIES: hypothetical protein [unclassified Nocardioides]KRA32625.1 hypothetical protein ASD81_13915 [Nocardioides sp. Root614]KRA89278.1 hypothetical protein ASD84_14180 [Nocardioides sp. Root682]